QPRVQRKRSPGLVPVNSRISPNGVQFVSRQESQSIGPVRLPNRRANHSNQSPHASGPAVTLDSPSASEPAFEAPRGASDLTGSAASLTPVAWPAADPSLSNQAPAGSRARSLNIVSAGVDSPNVPSSTTHGRA